MEILFIILVNSTANILCFFLGTKIVQKVMKNENLEIPKIENPIKKVEENKEKKVLEKEIEKNNIILENIENYDGTPIGQKELPRE